MKQRALSIICALALVAAMLPPVTASAAAPTTLTVGGTTITSSGYWTTNADGTLTADMASADNYNVYYDGNGTLTLKDATINGTNTIGHVGAGIFASGDLTIVLEGSSTVKGVQDPNGETQSIRVEGNLTIQGSGSLTAKGADTSRGSSYGIFVIGSFTQQGGSVTAIGGNINGNDTSTGLYVYGGTVTAQDGTLTATGGDTSGSSYGISMSSSSSVTVGSAAVTATGGTGNYSYGLYVYSSSPSVTLSGGSLTARSGSATNRAGGIYIQNIYNNSGGSVTVGENSTLLTNSVIMYDNSFEAKPLAPTGDGSWLIYGQSNQPSAVGGNYTLKENITIPEDVTLTIPAGGTLTVPTGITLTVNGTLNIANQSSLTGSGTLNGSGAFNLTNPDPVISGSETLTYDGTDHFTDFSLTAPTDKEVVMGKEFAISDDATTEGWRLVEQEIKNAGTYTLTAKNSDGSRTVTKEITVSKATSSISINNTYNPGKTYDGTALANPTESELTLTGAGYNDVTFTWYEGTSPNGTKLDSAPTDTGTYYLVASISESNNTTASEATSGEITISPATISISSATVEGKTYDGNIDATVESVTFNDLNGSDILTIGTDYTATAVFENANAGESKSATVTVTLNNGNYTFGSNSNTANTTATAAIQQAALTVTAPSETITVGDPIPDLNSLKVTVTGLVGNDTFSGVTLTYDGNPDNSQPGTWAIKPSGASLTTGNMSNYTVSYVNGTLTVEKKPVSGGGTSGGTTTPSGPSTGGSDGWTEIEDEVDETPSGSTVTVDMNGTTEVPAEVFEAVAGKDVTLELDMGGGVKWEINGQDIPTDLDITDLDLGVSLNTSDIPMDVINMVTGEKSTVQLSLAHDGEFGFTMTLTAPVGTQNKGLWANLYHYDTTRKQMLFETAAQVDASGNVALKLSHASEYAIVLDESSHELPFTDTAKGAWYQGAVEYVYRNSIMTGTSATTFEPNTTLSRAMVAQILYNLEGQPTVEGESTFADASGHWAVNAIAWAQQTGVVNGYEDNTFRPNRAVSREELAQMLYNYAKVKGYDLTASGDLTAFPDGSKVSSWAEAAMAWANGNELINGHDDGTLQPGGDSTRAQAASILMNFDVNLAN